MAMTATTKKKKQQQQEPNMILERYFACIGTLEFNIKTNSVSCKSYLPIGDFYLDTQTETFDKEYADLFMRKNSMKNEFSNQDKVKFDESLKWIRLFNFGNIKFRQNHPNLFSRITARSEEIEKAKNLELVSLRTKKGFDEEKSTIVLNGWNVVVRKYHWRAKFQVNSPPIPFWSWYLPVSLHLQNRLQDRSSRVVGFTEKLFKQGPEVTSTMFESAWLIAKSYPASFSERYFALQDTAEKFYKKKIEDIDSEDKTTPHDPTKPAKSGSNSK
jgi:hypothetical protein